MRTDTHLRTYKSVASQVPCHPAPFLTCDDATCLTRCHRAFVSRSCHFFRAPLSIPWRHFQSLVDADQPIRKVPSRDGYPRRSSLMVQHRWEMKNPAAECIGYNPPWIVSQYSRTRCAVPRAGRPRPPDVSPRIASRLLQVALGESAGTP